jgi:hypothetical protein
MIHGTSVDERHEERLMRSANTVKFGGVRDDAMVNSQYLLSTHSPEILQRWSIYSAVQG